MILLPCSASLLTLPGYPLLLPLSCSHLQLIFDCAQTDNAFA